MAEDSARSPLAAALDTVGDRWTLLLVDALLDGPRRFGDLAGELDGIAPTVLTGRLRRLEAEAIVVAEPYSERPPRFVYELTAAGRELAGALRLLADWGGRHRDGADPPRHAVCGSPWRHCGGVPCASGPPRARRLPTSTTPERSRELPEAAARRVTPASFGPTSGRPAHPQTRSRPRSPPPRPSRGRLRVHAPATRGRARRSGLPGDRDRCGGRGRRWGFRPGPRADQRAHDAHDRPRAGHDR